jgi:hypothetical protein
MNVTGPIHRPAAEPQRRTGPDRLRHRRRQDCSHFSPPPGPHRRPRRAEPRRHRRQSGRVGRAVQPAAADARADDPPHRPARPALAPDHPRTRRRPRPCPVPVVSRPVRGRQPGPAARPRAHAGSMSMLVRRPGRPPLMMVGDVTYDARLLETGHVPGVGSRRRLREATAMVNEIRQRYPAWRSCPLMTPERPAAWPRPPARPRRWRARSRAGCQDGDRFAGGNPGRRHDPVDPGSRRGRFGASAAVDPARSRPSASTCPTGR